MMPTVEVVNLTAPGRVKGLSNGTRVLRVYACVFRQCREFMRVYLIIICLLAISLESSIAAASAQARIASDANFPWAPEARCKLNPAKPQGLHPDAYSALQKRAIAHRITQGINHSPGRGNVHDTDITIKGVPYTGAADISVRCLTEAQIRTMLAALAELGFAGWYRKDGHDDWTGPPHIHAVFAGSALKPVLRRQVESWLEGRNGLGSNEMYRFWQPSAGMKDQVRALYRKFN